VVLAAAAPKRNDAAPAPANSNATSALAAADVSGSTVAVPRPKTKKIRPPEAPAERLVHVYDDVLPDGRRVPVYRRANGAFETGAVVEGEYRPGRTVQLREPRYFGLQ
jgi:hypothetical protein